MYQDYLFISIHHKDLCGFRFFIYTLKCKVCFLIENKERIVGCKWDTLTKHASHRTVMQDLLKLRVKKGLVHS